MKMFNLDGKTALITGGASGIGLGITGALANAGANVVIADLNGKAALDAAEAFGVRGAGIACDVTRSEDIASALSLCGNRFGGLQILVNNAGIGIHARPETMSLDDWDLNVDVNLRSVFACCRAAYPLLEKNGGKIINIGSMYAIFGADAAPAYAASKGGVVQLTKSLAVAWARNRIQANVIMPGWINTGLGAKGRKEMPGLDERVIARTPAGRWGEPADIAGTAVFLASKASDFVTGTAIAVDGGYACA